MEDRFQDRDGIFDTTINDYANTEDIVDLLNHKDKQIKELEKENLSLQEQSIRDNQNWIEENQQLKQQLHDLPNKIVEDITNELSNNTSLYFEMRESTSAHCPNQEYEWFNYVRFRDYVNAILKKYGGGNE